MSFDCGCKTERKKGYNTGQNDTDQVGNKEQGGAADHGPIKPAQADADNTGWRHQCHRYGDSGHIYGVKCAIRRLRKMYGQLPVEEVGPKAIKRYREDMIDEGCSRRYINDQVAHIKRMYRWGVAEELIHPDPSDHRPSSGRWVLARARHHRATVW